MSYPIDDHPALDLIAECIKGKFDTTEVLRESECVEFTDGNGDRFEIVVRQIDRDEDDEEVGDRR